MKISGLLNIDILEMSHLKRHKKNITTQNKSCFVLSCRLFGKSLFFYNGKTYTVARGDILYIPENSSYTQCCESEELICFHLEIDGEAPKELRICKTKNPDEMCFLFQSAYNYWMKNNTNYRYLCLSELYKIIGASGIFPAKKNNVSSRLRPALTYINSHIYNFNLSLDEACKKSAISRVYFNKLFKQQFNMSPIAYINKQRIKKAKILLKSGIYTREEIAFQCGFNDVKYFYTVFKSTAGMTTGKYLQKQK